MCHAPKFIACINGVADQVRIDVPLPYVPYFNDSEESITFGVLGSAHLDGCLPATLQLRITTQPVEKLGSRLCEWVLSGPGQGSAALANALGGVQNGRGAGG